MIRPFRAHPVILVQWLLVLAWAAPCRAEILTLYSDSGLHSSLSTVLDVYSGCGFPSGNAVLAGQTAELAPPEGIFSAKLSDADSVDCYFGWGAHFNTPQNMSRFNAGELRFWVYAVNGDIKIEIKDSGGNIVLGKNLIELGWGFSDINHWKLMRVPMTGNLTGSGLTSVQNPFLITALYGPGGPPNPPSAFFIDNVHFVDFTALPQFRVTLRNIGDSSPAASIGWSGAAAGNGWSRADQYIEVELDPDATAWGLQIYSDNKGPGADPLFSTTISPGQPGSNPAGLVDVSQPSKRIPLAWSVKGPADTLPSAANPNNHAGDPNSFQWLFLQDRGTPAIPADSTEAYQDGAAGQIVKNNSGIHFGQAPSEFGGNNPPNNIYLEADFSNATASPAGHTYKTNAIRLELFYP